MPDHRSPRIDWVERAAVGVSLACLLHCLALPLLIAALPVLSTTFATNESFHLGVLLFAVPTSAVALLSGRRRHRAALPLAAGALGLALLALGALAFEGTAWETPVTVVGSLTLAAAHVVNWRLRHRNLTSQPASL